MKKAFLFVGIGVLVLVLVAGGATLAWRMYQDAYCQSAWDQLNQSSPGTLPVNIYTEMVVVRNAKFAPGTIGYNLNNCFIRGWRPK
jgi:hypothetical protein